MTKKIARIKDPHGEKVRQPTHYNDEFSPFFLTVFVSLVQAQNIYRSGSSARGPPKAFINEQREHAAFSEIPGGASVCSYPGRFLSQAQALPSAVLEGRVAHTLHFITR